MDLRDRLKQLLVARSVRLGDFTLASGAKSSYYIDARRTTMSAEGQFLVGQVAYQAIRARGVRATHVGGLTMGADPIAYAIAHRSWIEGNPIDGFSIRKEPKGHGTGQQVEGGLPADALCLMVEDTMTTGESTLRAIAAVERHGATVSAVLTLVDRSEDATARYAAQGLELLSIFRAEELVAAARASSAS